MNREYLRTMLFGIEDSLVSTTGLVAGMSVGVDNKQVVLLAGLVAIFIEALSMGASEYLSDDAIQDLDKLKHYQDNPGLSGLLMFISYLLAGVVPLMPIIFFSFPSSLVFSVVFAFIGLFLLGYIKGQLLHISPIKGGVKVLTIGGVTTLLGLVVGYIFKLHA